MTEDSPKPRTGDSVLYAGSDYAGLFRRFVIVVVDGGAIFFAWFLLDSFWYDLIDPVGDPYEQFLWSGIAFSYLYLVILKPSPVRTLGFWVTGVRIVNHKGRPPSFIRMTFRVLLWLLGPFNPLIDFFWLGGDRHRQTLRDKFAGTYVIKRGALPIGHSKRKAAYYYFMGATLIFWEIQPVEVLTQLNDSR